MHLSNVDVSVTAIWAHILEPSGTLNEKSEESEDLGGREALSHAWLTSEPEHLWIFLLLLMLE